MWIGICRSRVLLCFWLFAACFALCVNNASSLTMRERKDYKLKVKEMFYHAYNNYMEHAFPHDELRPISATYNDVLAQLGNSSPRQKSAYKGVAMTLIDSLSTLAVMGDKQEFCRASKWITDNIDFNVDVRVNVFEANIRLVGGLLSAHMLASDPSMGFNTRSADEDAANGRGGDYSHQQDHDGDGDVDADDAKYHAKNHRKFTNVQRMKGGQRSEYVPPGRYKTKPTISRRWERAEQIRRAEADGSGLSADELKQEAERKREQREQYLCPGQDPEGLLNLAVDLGYRLLTAFDPESDLPYAWVNMKHGVLEQETQDTCTAGAGTLLLEFGLLSHLTGDPVFMQKADAAIMKLYSLKSELGLYGNSLNRDTGKWTNSNAGIGAGIDSFYEYLFKAYMMFGNTKYLRMFESAYAAVSRYCKYNDWYVEANMHSGSQSHVVFNSLQAFWPGLQVLVGDFAQAIPTQEQFFALWERYKALPERYHIKTATLHGSEKYYPLRPEFIESAFYLYRATHKPEYLEMGRFIVDALNEHTRTPYGFAQIKNVKTLKREDIMSSFFLSETCKYLYLLFDDDNFAQSDNIVFTTEGHPLPLMYDLQKQFGDTSEYYQDLDVETRRLIERTFRGQKTKEVKKGWIRAATDEDATRHQNRPDAVKDNRANAGDDDEEVEACPFYHHRVFSDFDLAVVQQQLRLKQEQRRREEARRELQRQQCSETGSTFKQGDFSVEVGDGSFHVTREVEAVWDSGSKGSSATTAQTGRAGSVGLGDRGRTKAEYVGVFHLGSKMVEVVNKLKHQSTIAVIDDVKQGVIHYQLLLDEPSTCATSNNRGLFPSVGAFFGPTVDEFLDRRSRSGRAKGAPGGDGKGDRWDTSDDLEGEREEAEAEAEAEEAEEEDNDNSASSGASVQAAHQHPRLTREFHLHGQLVLIADEDERVGCSPFSPAVRRSIKGNLVYIERGVCTFMQKALHAQQAGAVGVVMANTQTRDLFVMGQDGSGREVTIPTVMIDRHKSNLFKLCMQKKALMVEKRNKKEAVEGSAVNKQDRGAGGGEKRTTETQQDVTLSVSIIQTTVPLYHGQGEPSRHQPDLHSSVDPRRQEKLLSVYGNKEKFTVTAAGKWKALVEKQERDYVLKLL